MTQLYYKERRLEQITLQHLFIHAYMLNNNDWPFPWPDLQKKTLLTSMISNLKSCSDAQMANNTTRMIIIINMYGFEKIKRVMRIAVAITVLRFMVTNLCMLPVNKYTDDPTLGERHNKQYTNKYIVVYIFEHRQSTTTHGQGNTKSGRRSSRQGWTRFKPILNCLDVKPCDSQSYNNTTCDLKSCLCM